MANFVSQEILKPFEEEKINSYLSKFEIISRLNKWDEETMIDYLILCFKNYTVDLLIKHREKGYSHLKNILLSKYSKEQTMVEEKILMKSFEDGDSVDAFIEEKFDLIKSLNKSRYEAFFILKMILPPINLHEMTPKEEIVKYLKSRKIFLKKCLI